MAPSGPWPLRRRVGVAVSGGADSVCLAWLAKGWGDPVALIVDHGLRPGSAAEAVLASARLARFGVPAQVLLVPGLVPGPGLAARARAARYLALTNAAAALGLSDLLLGHHAGDQAETALMRREAGSSAAGMAAMAAVAEHPRLRLVRPLLSVAAGRLRMTLRQAGIAWIEDPSNVDPAALRTRLRARLAGDGTTAALLADVTAAASARRVADARLAAELATCARIHPEGYAVLAPGPTSPAAIGALIRILGGADHAPASRALARLAAHLRGTLGGVRLMPAGRLGTGTLLVREAAAMAAPVPAIDGAVWDARFRLTAAHALPPGATLGALGEDAALLRHASTLPYAVLRTLPVVRVEGVLLAVPQMPAARFPGWTNPPPGVTLSPPAPGAGAAWPGDAQAARTHHVRG